MTDQDTLLNIEEKKPAFFYGYVIVIAAFMTTLVAYGAQYSFGVFFKPLLAEFGWTRAATSGAYSLNFIMQGISGVFAGRLSDRFGPRAVVTVCGVLLGLGYLLMSQVQAIWHIYLFLGILVGAGACLYVSIMSTAVRWFVKRRGLMTGIIAAGTGVGITIVPPVANQLITIYSWRTSYIIVGLVALVVIVTAAQLLKRDPHKTGQVPYGERAVNTGKAASNISGLSLHEAVRTRQLWLVCGIIFALQICVQTVMVHIVPHAIDIGIPAATAASILSVIGALSIGSKIGMGSIVDRLGCKRVLAVLLVLMAGAFIWVRFTDELWMLYMFTLIFALPYGGQAAVQAPVVAEYFGLKAHGAIFGIVILNLTIGGAIGSLMAGRIFDTYKSYNPAFIICAALCIIGLLLLFALKPVRKGTTT